MNEVDVERVLKTSSPRSHEVSRALLEAAAAPLDSDTSLAELCRQVLVFSSTFSLRFAEPWSLNET